MSHAFSLSTPKGKVLFELVSGTLQSLSGEGCKVFSVVGNEPYFVPHFLKHYRKLGVSKFIFYLDKPSKGLCQYIRQQPDITAFTSKIPFGTVFGKHKSGALWRWHHLLHDELTELLLAKQWALSVDIDEFAVIPSQFFSLWEYCQFLDELNIVHVGAPMIELYPDTLAKLDNMAPSISPFDACKYFDCGPYYKWSDQQLSPEPIYSGIRQRLFEKIRRLYPDQFVEIVSPGYHYQSPKMWKVPLLKHGYGVKRSLKHEATSPPILSQGLALMHFRFFPGIKEKVADAIKQSQYYRNSMEYKLLDLALQKVADDHLSSHERARIFQGAASLVDAQLLTDPNGFTLL